jgi:hypothetical protein
MRQEDISKGDKHMARFTVFVETINNAGYDRAFETLEGKFGAEAFFEDAISEDTRNKVAVSLYDNTDEDNPILIRTERLTA